MTLRQNFEYASWKQVPLDEFKARWPSFSPQEIACKGDGKVMFNFAAMDALQRLRTALGKPIILNSAYRSPAWNKKVGGAKASAHLKGIAFDCQMTNHNPERFERIARECGFRGFGHYPGSNFMHVDTGNARRWKGTGKNNKWFFNQSSTGLKVAAIGDELLPQATPDFNAPVRQSVLDQVKESAPVLIPAVTGPLALIADGNGPVQWALGVILVLAVVAGAYWFFKRQRVVEENA